jgi:hypothetical protein
MRDVLVDLGGFPSEHVVLLKAPDSASLREQLARLSEQVKALGDRESLVVFYYSGHADPQHLHLRCPPLSHGELFEALRDLPATVRLGVLDACRSGSILQAKGAGARPPSRCGWWTSCACEAWRCLPPAARMSSPRSARPSPVRCSPCTSSPDCGVRRTSTRMGR